MTYNAYKLSKKIKKRKIIKLPASPSPTELYTYKELKTNHYIIIKDNQNIELTIKGLSALEEYAFQRRKYFIELAIALFTLILTIVTVFEQIFFKK